MDEDRALADAAVRAGNTGAFDPGGFNPGVSRPDAFEPVVRLHQGLCWHVAQRMVRHPDVALALCQEAFLLVYPRLRRFRGKEPANLGAVNLWVGEAAYSVSKRYLERKRVPLIDLAGQDQARTPTGPACDGAGLEADPDAVCANAAIAAALHAGIEALPPLQRTLLTLCHLDELSKAEMARIAGLSESAIRHHLFRSRAHLRARLEGRIGAGAGIQPPFHGDQGDREPCGWERREWERQERALHEERARLPIGERDPVLARYRLIARALRSPAMEPLPAHFTAAVMRRLRLRSAAVDLFEGTVRWCGLLGMAAAVASAALRHGGD